MEEKSEEVLKGARDPVGDEIQKILEGSESVGDPVPLNLDEEVADRLMRRDKINSGQPLETEDGEKEEDALDPNTGRETNFFKGSDPELAGIKAWSMQMPELPKEYVEPSEMDKRLYLKAMLNDVPLELTINLPAIDLHMSMRSLNNFEQNLIFHALELDQQDGDVAGPAQYVTWMQYHAAVMQITEFNGKAQSYVQFDVDDWPEPEKAVQKLREATKDVIAKSNWATWQVKVTGLRIFEIKLGLCNRAVFERNFWKPADSD